MVSKLEFKIDELSSMKKYPNSLFYIGNLDLLKREKISFVGSRSPNQYAKNITYQLSNNVIYKNKLKSTIINLNTIFYSHKIIYVL